MPASVASVRSANTWRTVPMRSAGSARDLVQRRPYAAVAWDAGFLGHLLVRQVQPIPRRRVPHDCALHQASLAKRRWRSVSMKDHSPSAPLMQQLRGHPTSPLDGSLPQLVEDAHASRNPSASTGRIFTRSG
jgi:hypothetical protein